MGSDVSTSSGGQANFSHDIKTQSGLTQLYNERVVSQERVTRPLGSSGGAFNTGNFHHEGVLVKTESGREYLVHKGSGFGTSRGGETVVVDSKHMSDQWTHHGAESVSGGKTVGGYVSQGGPKYNVVFDNCQDGARRELDYGRK